MCFDEVRDSFYLNNSKVKRDENEETLSLLYETDMMKEHFKTIEYVYRWDVE